MARFEFFDTFATYSSASTYESSAFITVVENDYCGSSNSGDFIETIENRSAESRSARLGFLSASESIYYGSPASQTYSYSRDAATNPICSVSDGRTASDGGITNTTYTAELGLTCKTTDTTTISVGEKQTTISTSTFTLDFGSYKDSASYIYGNFSATAAFGTTTQSVGLTLTVSTTRTGYLFCQPIRAAAFFYTLDPWLPSLNAGGRKVPGYFVTTPLSEGTSFSASISTGSHQLFSISSSLFTSSGEGSTAQDLSCYDADAGTTAAAGGSTSSSSFAETIPQWKIYTTQGDVPVNVYSRKRPTVNLYIDAGATPSSASLYSSFVASPAFSIGSAISGIFCQLSQHGYGGVYAPTWFPGRSAGSISLGTQTMPAVFSWSNFISLFYTTASGTSSGSGQIMFSKNAANSSQFQSTTESMDIFFPPYFKRSGDEFEPVESRGLSSGLYQILSTNSTGGTASLTDSGMSTFSVAPSLYLRPARKLAASYAHTTQSSTTGLGWDGNLVFGGAAAFSHLYLGGGLSRTHIFAEEFRSNNGERTVA